MKPSLTVIAGPTASGKTAIAIELARQHGGEIVSADSQQVYRHFDIGTAKPSAEELAAVPISKWRYTCWESALTISPPC